MSETRALRKWVDEQLARGCLVEDLVDAMIAVGHHPQAARTAVNEGVQRQRELTAAVATSAVGAPSGSAPARLSTPQPLPGTLAALPSSLRAEDREVRVLMARASPRVLLFGNVLSDEECDQLVEAARPRMRRSHTVDRATGGDQLHEARTSEDCYFEHAATPLVARINQRIAALCRWPLSHGEQMQILHYGVGAQYEPHYDWFDPADSGTAKLTAVGGHRVATLILYLNTPAAGGATTFPQLDLEVAAVKGNALFFSYDRPSPDTLTLHGGAPVTAGDKWIATRWMRERPYQS